MKGAKCGWSMYKVEMKAELYARGESFKVLPLPNSISSPTGATDHWHERKKNYLSFLCSFLVPWYGRRPQISLYGKGTQTRA